jgi:hypothetical protein
LVALFESFRLWRDKDKGFPNEGMLAICLLAGFSVVLFVMPRVPFPRTLVPLLPVWFAIIAYFVVHALKHLLQRQHLAMILGGVGGTSLLILANLPFQSCKNPAGSNDPYHYDLCHQYFRDQYFPGKVVSIWTMLNRKDVAIVADFEGFYSIRVLDTFPPDLSVFEYHYYEVAGHPNPLIVVNRHVDLVRITSFLGLDEARYQEVADTGYFKVYGDANPGAMPVDQQ